MWVKARHQKILYEYIKDLLDVEYSYISIDAINLYDCTNGFDPAINEFIDNHSFNFIYMYNAEVLMQKGAIGAFNGMEVLSNSLIDNTDTIVILSGKKNIMTELIKSSENSRDLFDLQFDFEDIPAHSLYIETIAKINEKNFTLDKVAEKELLNYLNYIYKTRGKNFRNLKFLDTLVEDKIIPSAISRIVKYLKTNEIDFSNLEIGSKDINASILTTIKAQDIPKIKKIDRTTVMNNFKNLIGLENIKQSITNHVNLMELNTLRSRNGLCNKFPPLHMVFTGNPGTGKTTIAQHIGEIYYAIGALSSGHVVETDRSKLVGQYLGETEKNTLNAIERASGGVLFIDEAYNLFVDGQDKRDFGHRVIETLLTYLSIDDSDMIVVLAGYTNEMEHLLESNPGLKSRFPYIYKFEDYSPDELMKIADLVIKKEEYKLSAGAEKALSEYVIEEYNNKDEHFGNGRFITRLLKSHIIPAVSTRISLSKKVTINKNSLVTIVEEDIPTHSKELYEKTKIDEKILEFALSKMDQLIGMEAIKTAIKNYIDIFRYSYDNKILNIKDINLFWKFIGNTGSGKSTIAEIFASVLQGLGLLKRGHTIIIKIEDIDSYEILEKDLIKATEGVLFIDTDAPENKNKSFKNLEIWLKRKVKELNINTALILAENKNDEIELIADNFIECGIPVFDDIVIFNDYTKEELVKIFKQKLELDFSLSISEDALKHMDLYITQIYKQSYEHHNITARTMKSLAQSIYGYSTLRIMKDINAKNIVILDDVIRFSTSKKNSKYNKIGY